MLTVPRHLRFARALALVSGLGACASPTPAPAPTPVPPPTAGGTVTNPCTRCTCDSSSVNPPSCYATGHSECCVDYATVEGPLPPPNLAAHLERVS